MLPNTEERVDRLEIVLEQFISQSNIHIAELKTAVLRMERSLEMHER